MSQLDSYLMRLRRERYRIRARRKGTELRNVADRTGAIRAGDLLLFSTLRNERIRLPYFLDYYRAKGVRHFLIVDNDSEDGSGDYLERQKDVSLWHTAGSYGAARFGVDWLNRLQMRYGHGHWTLVVNPDEFFIYPFCDTRPIQALTDWLDASGHRSFSAMMIDLYPKGSLEAERYGEGQDPTEIVNWFDSGNYIYSRDPIYHALSIRGGPRARVFYADRPKEAPSLNRIPLVKWHRDYVYVQSTQVLLPRELNQVYDSLGGEMTSGALLHTGFLDQRTGTAREQSVRSGQPSDHEPPHEDKVLWNRWSEKYVNWRQLEILGMISKGSWA